MLSEDAFIQAIIAEPEDDGHRLVFADWLEDRTPGDTDRAEFIRLQCAVASSGHPDRTLIPTEQIEALIAREQRLLPRQRAAWQTRLGEYGVEDLLFDRGFPEDVTMSVSNFLKYMSTIRTLSPVRGATLFHCQEAPALDTPPRPANFINLGLRDDPVAGARVSALAACPVLAYLTSLNLAFTFVGDVGASAFANCHHLANLTTLELPGSAIGEGGARALANSPRLAHLTSLDLRFNFINDAGARALANSWYLAHLTSLELEGNDVGDAVQEEISRNMAARAAIAGGKEGRISRANRLKRTLLLSVIAFGTAQASSRFREDAAPRTTEAG
jgi:uncharacterized protein (TIGR02996 family)